MPSLAGIVLRGAVALSMRSRSVLAQARISARGLSCTAPGRRAARITAAACLQRLPTGQVQRVVSSMLLLPKNSLRSTRTDTR